MKSGRKGPSQSGLRPDSSPGGGAQLVQELPDISVSLKEGGFYEGVAHIVRPPLPSLVSRKGFPFRGSWHGEAVTDEGDYWQAHAERPHPPQCAHWGTFP